MKLPKIALSVLLYSTLECLLFLLIRILESGTTTYYYMVVNLILAWIPLIISSITAKMLQTHHKNQQRKIFFFCFLLWLVFFPNAPYMVTDIIHLELRDAIPIWFDVLLLESFALAGLFIGYVSLSQMVEIIQTYTNQKKTMILTTILLFITSVGVSLGRFLRFNSWDLVVAPSQIVIRMLSFFSSPSQMLESLGFSFMFFLFLIVFHGLLWSIQKQK